MGRQIRKQVLEDTYLITVMLPLKCIVRETVS